MTRLHKHRQSGFGAIAAIVVLVLLAVLAAGIVSISTTQSLTVAQDVQSAQASQNARAGVEWGVYEALSGASCNGTPSINGVTVLVSCTSQQFNEGETCTGTSCTKQIMQVFTITAVASQGALSTAPGYVERRRQTIAACAWNSATSKCISGS